MQLRSSLGITFSCWRGCLCCPWHSYSMFFSITLGVALAAAPARCKALNSFPAEACEVCVKSFLAETPHFAWLYFTSPRFALHPIDVPFSDPQTSTRNSVVQGWVFGGKAAYLTYTKGPVSACVCLISDVYTVTLTCNEFVILHLGSTATPCTL